jgi:hypothetical protein
VVGDPNADLLEALLGHLGGGSLVQERDRADLEADWLLPEDDVGDRAQVVA